MIYLYLFGTCFHFIYVFMIIGNKLSPKSKKEEAVAIAIASFFLWRASLRLPPFCKV